MKSTTIRKWNMLKLEDMIAAFRNLGVKLVILNYIGTN